MPFSAINTYEEEALVRNERHTLEIQLEKAMSVYKTALLTQSSGKYDEAYNLYTKLFSYDVLRPQTVAKKVNELDDHVENNSHTKLSAKSLQLGPAIRLRAMALKNYALLFLTKGRVTNELLKLALTYLQEALDLVGTDDKERLILPSIVQIAFALKYNRSARVALEIMAQNDHGGALKPLDLWYNDRDRALQLLGPETINELTALDYMKSLGSSNSNTEEVPVFLSKYLHLRELEIPPEKSEDDKTLTVSMGSKSWKGLVDSINSALGTICKRGKRKYGNDLYLYASRDVWNVSFINFIFEQPVLVSEPKTAQSDDNKEAEIEQQTDSELAKESKEESETPSEQASKLDVIVQNSGDITPVSTREQTPFDDKFSSPAKRRRTGRSKRSALALPVDFGVVDASFVSQFNSYLSLSLGISSTETTADEDLDDNPYKLVCPAFLFLDSTQEIPSSLLGALELKDLLSQWDNRESSQFLSEATSIIPEKGGIMATLRSSSNQHLRNQNDSSDDIDFDYFTDGASVNADAKDVEAFVQKFNGQHIQVVRFNIARKLLCKLCTTNAAVAPYLGRLVFNFIDGIESMLFERHNFLTDAECTAVFALYADSWITDPTPDVSLKIRRWETISLRTCSVDHAWISVFADQELEAATPENSIERFRNFLDINAKDGLFSNNLMFTHLVEIPIPSRDNAQLQISKFKAAASFEKVLTAPADIGENQNNIHLLEAMLMPHTHARPSQISEMEFEAIQQFLEYVQPQFKLGLWYILLERYEDNSSISDSLHGLNQTFLESLVAFEKGEPLLTALSIAHDVAKRLTPLFERNPRILFDYMTDSEAKDMMKNVIKVLQILQLFLLYDDAVNSNLIQKPATPTWPKVLAKFRELITMWWCIFFQYWQRLTPSDNIEATNDFLSIIHERLGNIGYCGVANMCLLKLHINVIARLDWLGSALDFCQCLNCMFGISWSLYGDVAKHHTVPTSIKLEDSTHLLPMVMKLILNHKYLNQTIMRNDTRSVMDEFSKALANYKNSRITSIMSESRSSDETGQVAEITDSEYVTSQFYKYYLDGDFSSNMLRQAWHGHNNGIVELISHSLNLNRVDEHGLSLIQGAVIVHQYKLRRKQVYNAFSIRIETLDQAIALFIDDIVGHPDRIEAWAGIATANALYCEDAVQFGSELNLSKEPYEYCKYALIAASRAVSLMLNNKKNGNKYEVFQQELYDSLCPQVWSILGKFLLMSTLPPFCKLPFERSTPARPFLVDVENSDVCRVALKPPGKVQDSLAWHVAVKCLARRHDDQSDWVNLYQRTVAARKLQLPPKLVLKYMLDTLEICPSQDMFEMDVELVGLVWRYLRNDNLPPKELIAYLRPVDGDLGEPYKEKLKDDNIQKSELLDIVAKYFETLAEKDKWLHKAKYYLAKLWELDRKDTKMAQEQLMYLFTLKSPTKPLVIWQRNSDLPGQYSVSMNVYVKYMGDLMVENMDSDGMLLLVKRFRKSSVEFWDHTKCFEKIYSQCCLLFRRCIGLHASANAKLSDPIMSELASKGGDKFDQRVKLLCDENRVENQENELNDENAWVQALFYVSEIRRANIGPATSALADELLILTFYGILQRFVPEKEPTATQEPNKNNPSQVETTPPQVVQKGNNSQVSTQNQTEKPNDSQTPAPSAEKPVQSITTKGRKKIIRKDVVNAALQFLRPFNNKLSKLDVLKLPTDFAAYVFKAEELKPATPEMTP